MDEWDAEINRRWRAFGMIVKAKIVAVEEGISTIEKEFFGNVLLANGKTVAETYADNLETLNCQHEIKALGVIE